jgi:hypothetical protein
VDRAGPGRDHGRSGDAAAQDARDLIKIEDDSLIGEPAQTAALHCERLGKQLYGKRQVTIEPVFANTKFNRRIDRFLRRGRSACRSEWRLITATHNLLKLHSSQAALATA